MKRCDLYKLSILNIFSVPVRSLLTVLGFAIGVAAILAVLTLGDAGRAQVEDEMNRLGISKVWLTPSEDHFLQQGTGEWLTQTIGAETQEIIYLPVYFRGIGIGRAIACQKTYLDGMQLTEGRMLWNSEWNGESQSALVGKKAAEKYQIAAGDFVRAAGRTFEVCGVIAGGDNMRSAELEETVILPYKAAVLYTGGTIHEIQISAMAEKGVDHTQQQALDWLEKRGQKVNALNMQVQMDAASSVIFTFVNVLKWVAMVCILVGGIGVMNMMLVNVRERKREIGIMKSMGTTQWQICLLFLLEAVMYAAIGGILGVLLGFCLIEAAGRSIQLEATADFAQCILVMGCALATGAFFGVFPAFRASRMTCVDALRQE